MFTGGDQGRLLLMVVSGGRWSSALVMVVIGDHHRLSPMLDIGAGQ